MEAPELYIPIDRRVAMARGQSLPEHSRGAALFADVSGFTPLTDALVRALGPQRGAEELPRQLNRVYDALIAEVDRWGGSVIGFSGDAITCWFDGDPGQRAIAASVAMQAAMAQFAVVPMPDGTAVALAVKIAVAVGPVRRFVVGDPAIQQIDVLAGATLERLAAAEHQAAKGEIVVDADIAPELVAQLAIQERRADPETGRRYLVVEGMREPVAAQPWPAATEPLLAPEQARPWLLAPVHARLETGLGEFLTELRPVVALFVRFGTIDYDADPDACAKLDAYVSWAQRIIVSCGGYLIQLTVGDKGSYFFAAFGAPVAHDDDVERALVAALQLRATPPELSFVDTVQVGISRGRMRTGAYGGSTARTYGVLGPETNMAARLMQHAAPGSVLVNQTAQREAAESFAWEPQPPLSVKGKVEPATVYRLVERRQRVGVQLQEPRYALPMVGRDAELALATAKLRQALAGRGQIVAITAEAGMGKSRLIAELVRAAEQLGLRGYGGECQSYGMQTSYLVWEGIWRAFFGIDAADAAGQIRQLEAALAAIDDALTPRLPLLGTALNLPIADNELTASLDPKLRKASLEALLVECVRARAAERPLLFVLEDCHWIDPLSHELLETLGRAVADLPVAIVVAYRPPDMERLQAPRVTLLPHCTVIPLGDFTVDEAAALIGLKLAELAGPGADVPAALVERVTERAQGNPFYIEELLNYLRDQGVDARDARALDQLDLPTSLHSLILSRIDQLSETQKITIKVASIVGRLFQLGWLWGAHPGLGRPHQVRADLDALSRLDLTPIDQPEPQITYLFKHIVTREVAYESLPFATREVLHDQLAQFIESSYAATIEQYVDLLAYHFDHSQNLPKRQEYLAKAGAAAQAAFANDAAIDYYERLVPLLSDPAAMQQTHASLGRVLATIGQYERALSNLHAALTLAGADPSARAQACRWIAYVYEFMSEFGQSLEWIQRGLVALDGQETEATAELLAIGGLLATRQGNVALAQEQCERSIAIAQRLGAGTALAFAYNSRAIVFRRRGNHASAIEYFGKATELYGATDNVHGQGMSYNGIANSYSDTGHWSEAARFARLARDIFVRTGDELHRVFVDNNLGEIARNQGHVADARRYYLEALGTLRQLGGSAYMIAILELNLGATELLAGDTAAAERYLTASAANIERTNARDLLPALHQARAETALARRDLQAAAQEGQQGLAVARELEMDVEAGTVLRVLGAIAAARGDVDAAALQLGESLTILEGAANEFEAARTRLARARLALDAGRPADTAADLAASAPVFERLAAERDLALVTELRAALERTA